jgi:alpha-1,2-mannosyltransferase
MNKVLQQALIILGLNIIVALLIGITAGALGYKESTLPVSYGVLRGDFDRDSWMPMERALNYWDQEPRPKYVYHDLLVEKNLKFQYPPITLLLPKLITIFHIDKETFYHRATYIFLIVTIVAVLSIVVWSCSRYGNYLLSWRDICLLLISITGLTLTYYPIVVAASLGQIQLWLNAIFAISLLCYLTKHYAWAGAFIGFISLIKPQYSLFIFWGVVRGNKRFTMGFLCTACLGLAIGVSIFGVSTHLDYVEGVRFLARHGEAFFANQTFNGLVNRIFSIGDPELYNNTKWSGNSFPPYNPWVFSATLISSVTILAVCLIGRRPKGSFSQTADYCLMALGVTMASPIGWTHHYGILLPIFAFLWPLLWFDDRFSENDCARLIVMFCYLLSSNFVSFANMLAPTFMNFLQSYLLFAALGVFVVLFNVRRSTHDGSVPLRASAAGDGNSPRLSGNLRHRNSDSRN